MFKNKRFIIIIISLLCCCALFSVTIFSAEKKELLSLNGMEVSQEEFVFSVENVKARVKNNLLSQYKVDTMNFDWQNKYGDKTGFEYLQDEALIHLKYIKIQQNEAMKANIIENFNYPDFLNLLAKENELRKKAVLNNQTIFGPEVYSEKQYYQYFNNNIEMKLKKSFIEQGKLPVSNEMIEKCYLENKEYFLNKELSEVKESVILLIQDQEYENYINEQAKEASFQYDKKEISDIIKQIVK